MIRAMYTASSGTQTIGTDMYDMLAHNLANIDTPGFRAQYMTQSSLASSGGTNTDYQVGTSSYFEDKRPGPSQYTGEKLDLELEGDAYFTVQTVDGVTAYSRNGRLKLQADGSLTDKLGNPIMGDGGPITIPRSASSIVVDEKGNISADGVKSGKLKLTSFDEAVTLKPIGGGLYQAPPDAEPKEAEVSVRQGYYQRSNVSAVAEMVRMMETVRSVESYTKFIIAASDDTTGPLVRGTGKVG